jgi:hypothetical protein
MAEYMCLQCGASRIKEKDIQTHLANAHHTGANKILQGQGQVKVKDPMSNRVGWYIARRFEACFEEIQRWKGQHRCDGKHPVARNGEALSGKHALEAWMLGASIG